MVGGNTSSVVELILRGKDEASGAFDSVQGSAGNLGGVLKLGVVGGAGLIGSHTVDKLLKEDVKEVLIYDNFLQGSPENLTEAPQDARVKIYDICAMAILLFTQTVWPLLPNAPMFVPTLTNYA